MIPLLDTNVLIRFLTFDKGKKYKKLYALSPGTDKPQSDQPLRRTA